MSYIDTIKERARLDKKTIVLPESNDKRTLLAAAKIMEEGIADIIMIGNEEKIMDGAGWLEVDLSGVKVIDPSTTDKLDEYVNLLYETRKAKGMTEEMAREILLKDYLTFGIVMVKANDADGMVAGACHSTADTLRPALQILKTAPGVKLVSAFFIMDTQFKDQGENGTFLFADCGLNQDPNAEEMAAIAHSSSKSFRNLVGGNPIIAMLSHSTKGSAKHPLVDKRLRPDAAILDSDLLQELPKGLVAETGFDALSHAVEAYAAKNAGAMTDLYAREAFSSAFAALPASYAGRKDVRLKVHQAATMAGIAFTQAGLGLCHAMAHSLGGLFHVPHGRLNAILLPSVITCNAHVAAKKYAELARAAGIGGSADTIAVRNLKNGLVRLRRELNLPETLAQAGVDPRSVWRNAEQIVKATLEDPCCKTNPMEVEDFLVRRILEEVTGRV